MFNFITQYERSDLICFCINLSNSIQRIAIPIDLNILNLDYSWKHAIPIYCENFSKSKISLQLKRHSSEYFRKIAKHFLTNIEPNLFVFFFLWFWIELYLFLPCRMPILSFTSMDVTFWINELIIIIITMRIKTREQRIVST